MQFAVLFLGGIMLAPTIVYRAAGAADATIAWVVFVALVVTGVVTALQGFPTHRFGAGYVLITGTSTAAVAVSVDALDAGGASLLASLMIAAALFQFVLSYRISMFRRVITPVVSGTVMMLIPVPIAPIIFGNITEVPAGFPPSSGIACALATMLPIVLVILKGSGRLLPWSALIGIGAGAVAAAAFGLYDFESVAQAAWVGLPSTAWPVSSLDLGQSFWALLPAFLIVAMSGTIRTMSASLAIQDVSWRTPRAPDLRAVQGAVAADSLSNLLAGIGGSVMNLTRSTTISLTRLNRIASRWVGLSLGVTLVVFAFLPKIGALILALPPPVLSAYLTVMVSTSFVAGAKLVVADGIDHRQMLIVGLSFWIGVGCQYGLLLPEILPEFAGGLLNNGLSSGGLTAILLTVLVEFSSRRRHRFETDLDVSRLAELREFISRFTVDSGWPPALSHRMEAVTEETLLTLNEEHADPANRRRLKVTAHREGDVAVLEFIAKSVDSNIEDRLALLGEISTGHQYEREVSLRLLRHLASDVRHRQYHDMDFITVRVAHSQNAGK